MASSTLSGKNTLGDRAVLAIKKHFEKFLKHEADVIADSDPEALHQMRVGMRRLRSAIAGFAPAIDLPKPVQEKKIGKIARILGSLRDLDVLRESLENKYKPALPADEQEQLDTALVYLYKRRRKVFAKVHETLTGDRYQELKQALEKWLSQPQLQPIAQMPIQATLPDLLLSEVGRLLLHPSWLVGTKLQDEQVVVQTGQTPEQAKQQLIDNAPLLHSLRKETKRARYQMEVFANFYGASYETYLEDLKAIQSILGQFQDSAVLSEFLADALQSKIEKNMPTLANLLAEHNYQAWQQWQSLQQRYLNLESRKGLHMSILMPTWENVKNGQSTEHDTILSQQS
ncbi:CHAD domain-containing protein [Chroococcidiopsis thermalis]|jgi:CHAD domain-containing protein|uniref:CHAD domain containing protein n=1 Tax=Chroococcidiopsis thermalis (strain PCC 7203) TaxID=251229 RepID=K9U3Y6_CHRTP|nr:CHAD domain-containing protein [Chroococcidiopsis thermalis]AFY88959.1 CHAD domain containing protein [Chroococcidiopsis thermalis PCC 7203]